MIAVLSDDEKQKVGFKIYKALKNKNIDADYISVTEADVKPCYSCGGCTDKTYGKCVIRDDADKIFPKLLNADTWLIVSPLSWGSYSFKMKRVLDKVALIGDRHYFVKQGELVKKMGGNVRKFYAVGVKDNCSEKEKDVFFNLVSENINIMSILGNSFVLSAENSEKEILQISEEVSRCIEQ
jgi:multimeric flavodoxin WrbA